ncbi:MAG TPA: PHB depolymerase family esterase [Rubrobacteraceae bacterium]|nr:PHB depolymerase family esterase [Rubrobacteraceae bacterium]
MANGEGIVGRSLGRVLVLAVALLALATVACGGLAGDDGSEEGSFTGGSFSNEHGTRDYRLYVPGGYEEQRVPLVVLLHGCRQDAEDSAAGTRMNVLAEREMFLALYPEQDSGANSLNCWNWFDPDNQKRGGGEPSVIAGATEKIIAEHNVDPDRVYVAGISAGGAMTSILGATYPDLCAAIGVHSGLEYKATEDSRMAVAIQKMGGPDPDRQGREAFLSARSEARVIPTIVFHGEDDSVVDVVNAHQTLSQWAQTNDYADDGSDNGSITDEPADVHREQAPEGYDYGRYVYEDPEGDVIMEKWIVEELGHDWSGGDTEGSYADPEGPDASKEMVRFFDQHPKR